MAMGRCALICRRFHRSGHKCPHRDSAQSTGYGLRTEVLFGRQFYLLQNQGGESASRQVRQPANHPASEETQIPCRTSTLMVRYTASRPLRGLSRLSGWLLWISVVRNIPHCKWLSANRNFAPCGAGSVRRRLLPRVLWPKPCEIRDGLPCPGCCDGRMSRYKDRSPDHHHQKRIVRKRLAVCIHTKRFSEM